MSSNNSNALSDIRRVRRDRYGMTRVPNRYNFRMRQPTPSILSASPSYRTTTILNNRIKFKSPSIVGKSTEPTFNQALYSSLSSQEEDIYRGLPHFSRNIGSYGNSLFNNKEISQSDLKREKFEEIDEDNSSLKSMPLGKRNYLRDFSIIFILTLFIWGTFSYYTIDIKLKRVSYHSRDDSASKAKEKFTLFERTKMMNFKKRQKTHPNNYLGNDARYIHLLAPLSNMTTPFEKTKNDTPFFLDIHLTGSHSMKKAFSKCFNLIQACEFGLRQPYFNEESLGIFDVSYDSYNATYVNVNTKSEDGIERAKRLNLTASQMSDVIISPHLFPGVTLFNMNYTGRMFSLFAHPIDRAVALKNYIGEATWDERYNEKVKRMTLRAYAKSKFAEDNPITRLLTAMPGKNPNRKLTVSDLSHAKYIVANKCLVGLYDEIEGSMARFGRYFKWQNKHFTNEKNNNNNNKTKSGLEEDMSCIRDIEKDKWLTSPGSKIEKDSFEYGLLAKKNVFDILLYEFIQRIYEIQGEEIFHIV